MTRLEGQQPMTPEMYLLNKKRDQRVTGPESMGKDAFMKILIAQLQNQDPTNPMKDNEFIAQMAQFSSLEQTMNLANAFEKFAAAQNETQLIQYNNFVGKTVRWHEITNEKDEEGKNIIHEGSNVIKSAKFVKGSVVFILDNGKEITPGNVSEVLAGSTSANGLVEASLLIGKTVTYRDGEEEKTGRVQSVSNKEGKLTYILSDGSKVDGKNFIQISE